RPTRAREPGAPPEPVRGAIGMKRDLLSFADLTRVDVDRLFAVAARLKADRRSGKHHRELDQRSLALIFHKPSPRTRLPFAVALTQLGRSSASITAREVDIV